MVQSPISDGFLQPREGPFGKQITFFLNVTSTQSGSIELVSHSSGKANETNVREMSFVLKSEGHGGFLHLLERMALRYTR